MGEFSSSLKSYYVDSWVDFSDTVPKYLEVSVENPFMNRLPRLLTTSLRLENQ